MVAGFSADSDICGTGQTLGREVFGKNAGLWRCEPWSRVIPKGKRPAPHRHRVGGWTLTRQRTYEMAVLYTILWAPSTLRPLRHEGGEDLGRNRGRRGLREASQFRRWWALGRGWAGWGHRGRGWR